MTIQTINKTYTRQRLSRHFCSDMAGGQVGITGACTQPFSAVFTNPIQLEARGRCTPICEKCRPFSTGLHTGYYRLCHMYYSNQTCQTRSAIPCLGQHAACMGTWAGTTASCTLHSINFLDLKTNLEIPRH